MTSDCRRCPALVGGRFQVWVADGRAIWQARATQCGASAAFKHAQPRLEDKVRPDDLVDSGPTDPGERSSVGEPGLERAARTVTATRI